MAKQYSLSYIKDLHKRKKAELGVKYHTKDRTFIGDENGYMLDITELENNETVVNNITIVEADLTALENRVTLIETNKADKCFTIAMSIAL